ncbi:MAG: hypothetical protein Q9184_003237 [Pyrenodesmia sp. 2 TL-2023]
MSPAAPMADHAYGVDSLTTSDDGQSPLSSPDAAQDREATEMHDYNNINSTVELNSSAIRLHQSKSALKTFWDRHVVATVPYEACRDHFALERTYLGYFRTSLALAFLAVFVAQLFRLQHAPHPDPVFGFFVVGIPLSCICTGAAILVNLLGTYRFWRQQNAILRGKVLSGGWEMMAILGVVLVTITLLFVLVVAVDISKN